MKNIKNKKLITWICLGVSLVAVIVLCVCLTLGDKDKSGNKGHENEGKENHQQEEIDASGEKDSDIVNPSVELEDDFFENKTEDKENHQGNSGNSDDNSNNGMDDSSSNDNSGRIVLPEVVIP